MLPIARPKLNLRRPLSKSLIQRPASSMSLFRPSRAPSRQPRPSPIRPRQRVDWLSKGNISLCGSCATNNRDLSSRFSRRRKSGATSPRFSGTMLTSEIQLSAPSASRTLTMTKHCTLFLPHGISGARPIMVSRIRGRTARASTVFFQGSRASRTARDRGWFRPSPEGRVSRAAPTAIDVTGPSRRGNRVEFAARERQPPALLACDRV